LDKKTLSKLDRQGTCLSCHKEIPHKSLAVSAMVHMAEMSGVNIDREFHDDIVHKSVLLSAWVQVFVGIIGLVLGGLIMRTWMRRRKKRL
jgi:hydrogenase maturation factor